MVIGQQALYLPIISFPALHEALHDDADVSNTSRGWFVDQVIEMSPDDCTSGLPVSEQQPNAPPVAASRSWAVDAT
jgi:hypothetical protein